MDVTHGPGGKCRRVSPAMFLLLCSAFTVLVPAPQVCWAETAILDVRYRTAQELLPIVESVISGEGRVTLHRATNSLVVTAGPETIRQVRQLLAHLDKPIQQVRVRVRFEKEQLEREQAVSGDITVSGDDWRVTSNGRTQDGADVRLRDQRRQREETGEYVVTVMSGTEAYIVVGEDLPVTDRWHHLCRRYHGRCRGPGFQRMETGLQVIPIIRGDQAILQVTPTISEVGSHPGSVQFTGAATTVTVPLNRWIQISRVDQNANEVMREILSAGRREQGASLSLWLKVEKDM